MSTTIATTLVSDVEAGLQRPASPSLRKNFSWTLTGNVVYAACQWGVLTAFAKMGDATMLGQFAFALAITTPITQLFSLQLRPVQATDAVERYRFHDYLGLRIIASVLALLVIAVISFGGDYSIATAQAIGAVAVLKTFDAISDVFCGLMQKHEEMRGVALVLIVNGAVSLGAVAIALGVSNSVLWAILASASGSAVALLLSVALAIRLRGYRSCWRALLPRWQWRTLWELFLATLPLGGVIFIVSINVNVPRYAVEKFLGVRALGLFAGLAYIGISLQTVCNALGQSASPRLAQYFSAGDVDHFRKLLIKVVGVVVLIGLAAVLACAMFGELILRAVYSAEFVPGARLLVPLMIAATVSNVASLLGFSMTAARQFWVQAPLFLTVCAVTSVASFYFVPRHGLDGAVYATLAGAVTQLIASVVVISQAINARRRLHAS